jgi:hypothetical protein
MDTQEQIEEFAEAVLACGIDCGPDVHVSKHNGVSEVLLRCVTCPFCFQLVDAILTPSLIICPKCDATAKRGGA